MSRTIRVQDVRARSQSKKPALHSELAGVRRADRGHPQLEFHRAVDGRERLRETPDLYPVGVRRHQCPRATDDREARVRIAIGVVVRQDGILRCPIADEVENRLRDLVAGPGDASTNTEGAGGTVVSSWSSSWCVVVVVVVVVVVGGRRRGAGRRRHGRGRRRVWSRAAVVDVRSRWWSSWAPSWRRRGVVVGVVVELGVAVVVVVVAGGGTVMIGAASWSAPGAGSVARW